MKSQFSVTIITVLLAANVVTLSNVANAVVSCVDKYHHASVIPCSDQNAIIAPSGGNMTANTTNAGTNVTRSFPNATVGNVNFLTYTNDTYGLKIQYPSNWLKEESHNQTSNDIVKFSAPNRAAPASLNIVGGKPAPQNIPLITYIDASIDALRQSFSNFSLIGSNATTLGDSPAQKIVYTATLPLSGVELKFMQIFTIKDSKSFVITFGTLPTIFSTYLPTVQKMIDSFAFTSIPKGGVYECPDGSLVPIGHENTCGNLTAGSNMTNSSSATTLPPTPPPATPQPSSSPAPTEQPGWWGACNTVQSYLLQPCSVYLNPDGTTTSEGDRAFGCIRNGAGLALAGISQGLPLSTIISGLRFAEGPTGCGGIVNWDKIPSITQLESFLHLFGG
jgi:hypothetical protein